MTITRFYDSSVFNKGLAFTCFTGIKGPIDVATTVQVREHHGDGHSPPPTTASPLAIWSSSTGRHGGLNEGSSGPNSWSTITVTGATTFTYTANLSQTASSTGKCFAVYNSGAHRTVKSSTYRAWLGPSDSASSDTWMSSIWWAWWFRVPPSSRSLSGRPGGADPPNYADTAFTTGERDGQRCHAQQHLRPGSVVFRTLQVGQKIALISPNSASAEIVTIATKPTATQFTAIVTNGTTTPPAL